MPPVIVWFRRNLRLCDNAALIAAADSGCPIVPVYVLDELDCGGASRWWLHFSLERLDKDLKRRHSRLILRRGRPERVLAEIAASTGAAAIYYARRYEPLARAQESRLGELLGDSLDIHPYDDYLLRGPSAPKTQSDTPFKVFTPYWKASVGLGDPPLPSPAPSPLQTATDGVDSLALDELALLPTSPDWAQGLRDTWTPGEDGAAARLDVACTAVKDYADGRDRPDRDLTSKLSPHLHFGELSPRQVWHAVKAANLAAARSRGAEAFLRQLYWRDFSHYLLFHFPDLPEKPLREEFEHFPWHENAAALEAWQCGWTGFPIVDAGMRQLWATGWMHNRVRMIVASFLVKDLMIPWQQGADWFLDTLVDADLGNNSASWQWVAGCGTDAAPYFRIFNPTLQGKKFDPNGDYIRRWVPELAQLPAEAIHEPRAAERDLLDSAGQRLGVDYPEPIVNHAAARNEALAAYQSMRDLLKSPAASPGSSVG